MATSDGKVFVINTLFGRTVYTTDIQGKSVIEYSSLAIFLLPLLNVAETEQQGDTPKEEDNEEHSQKPKPTNTAASISSIRFYKTYASLESKSLILCAIIWFSYHRYRH